MTALIRLASEADAAAIAAIYRPYVEESRISFEEEAPDAAEVAQRMTSPIIRGWSPKNTTECSATHPLRQCAIAWAMPE